MLPDKHSHVTERSFEGISTDYFTNSDDATKQANLNMQRRPYSSFSWFRSHTMKLGNLQTILSSKKISLGVLVFIACYILRRKQATLKRCVTFPCSLLCACLYCWYYFFYCWRQPCCETISLGEEVSGRPMAACICISGEPTSCCSTSSCRASMERLVKISCLCNWLLIDNPLLTNKQAVAIRNARTLIQALYSQLDELQWSNQNWYMYTSGRQMYHQSISSINIFGIILWNFVLLCFIMWSYMSLKRVLFAFDKCTSITATKQIYYTSLPITFYVERIDRYLEVFLNTTWI